MTKKVALITFHGMGKTAPDYNQGVVKELNNRLGPLAEKIHFGKVYYQGILQPNEDRVWESVSPRVNWDELRKFLLFGFADAAGLESNKEDTKSVYWLAQLAIAKELFAAMNAVGKDGPVIFLAHSLGCQVASCYLWDANLKNLYGRDPSAGIWKNLHEACDAIAGPEKLSSEEIDFLQGKTLEIFITTGCNIPIFVAAHAKEEIIPIQPNNHFKWVNYYDKDDVLGWPLSDLSEQYKKTVVDKQVNASGGVLGWLLKSWNPLSHLQYWEDKDILDPLEKSIRSIVHKEIC